MLSIDPDYVDAHLSYGLALLATGNRNPNNWPRGWKEYEWRWEGNQTLRQYTKPMWDGIADLQGKTFFLWAEQGLGETFEFVRYAQVLKNMGISKVIVAVQKPLYNLLSRCDYIDLLKKVGEPLGHYDDHTTLMSIPALLYGHEHNLPDFELYIDPDPDLVAHWGTYLAHDRNFKIGICWEASVHNDSSRPPVGRRGIPLEKLYILSELDNVNLYSLQQADGLEQLDTLPPYFNLHLFDATFDKTNGAFMDTAAVMKHLDLVITVDTAIAHLAGSMGVPVWLMLPWFTDWRWIHGRDTSPWYPSMRIFKQPKPFDWDSVVAHVFVELLNKPN